MGEVDSRGHLTGPEIAYVYPDYFTALVGQFSDGVMLTAREHSLLNVEEDNYGVKVPRFRKSARDHLHKRQIGCYNYICHGK